MFKELLKDAPDVLNASQISKLLCISRSGAYNLMNQEDFPIMKVGGRKMVCKANLIEWLEEHSRPKSN